MKPVFANSASVHVRESLVLRGGRRATISVPVRYGLFNHPAAGPVLIDTGYTRHCLRDAGRSRALRLYAAALRPELNEAGQPEVFLSYHGLAPEDVRFVIVTHFHADHISGLALFPNARFIVNDAAWSRVRRRSVPGNLRHGIFTELLPADFDDRLTGLSSMTRRTSHGLLPAGADLFGDGSLVAIDLPGHAEGQFGILFATAERPLLYGVDAQWLVRAVVEDRAPGFPARLVAASPAASRETTRMLRRFAADGGELLLCHDPEPTVHDFGTGRQP